MASDQQKAALVRRFGEILDSIDEQVREPGERSLRSIVAEHAREQLNRQTTDGE